LKDIMSGGNMECEVCGSTGGEIHRVREMMFGTGDEFRYGECRSCGCISLVDMPADLSRYYPRGYYSMGQMRATNPVRRLRDYIYLSPLSFLVNWHDRSDLDVIRRCRLGRQQRVLDVGCGGGHLIRDLRELGYRAEGIDPFVTTDITDRFGTRVFKRSLDEVAGRYDMILFRHSLEHMPRQLEVLCSARRRLVPGGTCVVCIPVVGWAWRHYGVHWSQLDAPRHFFLHTVKSFTQVAAKAGFRIERVVYDSDDFQFWVSDLYRQGKPLQGARRPDWRRMMRMRRRAKALNRAQDGDKAQFYMRAD
jgi:SAM-dependent methyltransferase